MTSKFGARITIQIQHNQCDKYGVVKNQKWIFLGEFDTVKPSGLPYGQNSEEDLKAAHVDGIEYVLPVEFAVPVRYIRMDVLETWGNTTAIHIAELTFWENPVK